LSKAGLSTGRVKIAHCANETAANTLKDKIQQAFPKVQVDVHSCLGLCSYYAEIGGLLVGFEKF
jgi:fatty acid-binding protein DegV